MIASAGWQDVTYEQNGRLHVGCYRLRGGMMTVVYEDDRGADHDRSCQVMPGGLSPERLATSLLGELVREVELGVPA